VGNVVTNVRLTDGGTSYSATPTVDFTASVGGSGAVAVASVTPASVASVTITNGGTNLTGTPTINFVEVGVRVLRPSRRSPAA